MKTQAGAPDSIPEEKTRRTNWYRTPIDKDMLQQLNQRSDAKGLLQTLGFLGLLMLTGGSAVYGVHFAQPVWPWWVVVPLVFIHGTFFAFLLNGFHELCHGTVFRTKWLNEMFLRIVSFVSWHNFVWFQTSHMKHHRHTLRPPLDLEVVLPVTFTLKNFFKTEFANPMAFWGSLKNAGQFCLGITSGEWGKQIFPQSDVANRRRLMNWARFIMGGHITITVVSIAAGYWMIPIVFSFARTYGEWLMFLCNSTQHVGMQDNVDDFRLNSRTILLNPFLGFLYWHMNYHIEHHMYAAVPCYNLGRLHRLIEKDLPHCPDGLVEAWRHIAFVMEQQKLDPNYRFRPVLPSAGPAASAA